MNDHLAMNDHYLVDFAKLFTLLLCLTSWFTSTSAAQIKDVRVQQLEDYSVGTYVGIAVGALVFCLVAALLISQCTDCYQAEVATESHPACGASKSYDYEPAVNTPTSHMPSYGHSGGDSAYNRQLVNSNSALPYSLAPSIPSGTPVATAPPMGPGGLGGNQWGAPQQNSQSGYNSHGAAAQQQPPPQRGRTYSGPEQPPSYNEAMLGGPR